MQRAGAITRSTMSRAIARKRERGTRWRSCTGSKGPQKNKVCILAADASRRASLLVAYILPVCALLAPCRAGASTPIMHTLFFYGPLPDEFIAGAVDGEDVLGLVGRAL